MEEGLFGKNRTEREDSIEIEFVQKLMNFIFNKQTFYYRGLSLYHQVINGICTQGYLTSFIIALYEGNPYVLKTAKLHGEL